MCLAALIGKNFDKTPVGYVGKKLLDSGKDDRPDPAPDRTEKKDKKRRVRKDNGLNISTQGSSGLNIENS